MGSFFTNVQVYVGERSVEEVRQEIVAALRQRALDAGLEEDATLEDDEAERVVMIGPGGPEPWIAVYDELTEGQDENSLPELGQTLSRVGAAAVTVLVHDSDILQMSLYRSGDEVDAYDSYPNYLREDPDEARAPASGQATRWTPVLAPGVTSEALQASWAQHDAFAEETVWRVASLFGWNQDQCTRGFRWLSEVADDVDGYTRLAFRPSTRLAANRPPIYAEGPPRFTDGGGQISLSASAGERFDGVGASFRSAGGPGRGVEVVIWGSAIEQGLIDPRECWLAWKPDAASQHERRQITLQMGQSTDGTPLRYAVVDDFRIPPGLSEAVLANPSSAEAAARPDLASHAAALMEALHAAGLTMHRMMELQSVTQVAVALTGEAVKPGSGQVHIGMTPLEHPDEQTSWTLDVTITEP